VADPRIELDFDKLVGSNVQKYRTASGLSQADLAAKLSADGGEHVHQQTIQKIEKGTRPLKFAEAVRIATVLKVPLASFDQRPGSVRADARLLKQNTALFDLDSLLKDLASDLAHELAQLAFSVAVDRSSAPEDRASHLRITTAEDWLATEWGERFSDYLLDAILSHDLLVASDIQQSLKSSDVPGVLAELAAIDVGRYDPRTDDDSEA
jgi:transcriptional regulator with XRE-family HTH domain